jgi:hypothetical protein
MLLTSAPADALCPEKWLQFNRQAWGIENGLHQRLDVSYNDDRCRVQNPKAMWALGIFRRIANSLFMEWAAHQTRPGAVTTTDFQTRMAEENRAPALRLLLAKRPSLKNSS